MTNLNTVTESVMLYYFCDVNSKPEQNSLLQCTVGMW